MTGKQEIIHSSSYVLGRREIVAVWRKPRDVQLQALHELEIQERRPKFPSKPSSAVAAMTIPLIALMRALLNHEWRSYTVEMSLSMSMLESIATTSYLVSWI